VGAKPLDPALVLETFLGGGSEESRFIVLEQRAPRTVAALAVGAALGAAGALIQGFSRNPLADPGILGVNAGAAFAVAVGITYLGITNPAGYVWLACLGAFGLTLIVSALGGAGRDGANPVRLTIAGVAMGAVLAGLTTGITLTHPDSFERMRGWASGSMLERGLDVVLPILPVILAGLLMAAMAAPALNSLSLGADLARAQGVSVRRTLALVLAAVALLAGGATAIAGPIVFVGLMVPHVVRWCIGADQRGLLAGSALAGAILVMFSDVLARIAVQPSEMPAGVVTAFLGAPVLVALVMRRSASAL
jgi:iron complex transport system permease protein